MATTSTKTTTSSTNTIDPAQSNSLTISLTYGGDGYAYLFGGDGMDVIYGSVGNDKIFGAGGDDMLYGGRGDDSIYGGEGNDWLLGEAGTDALYGNAGKDALSGGDGNDRLNGGAGKDFLFGGVGADIFEFDLTGDSTPGFADLIDDFSKAQGDVIDLSKIDAMAGSGANDSFHWVSTLTSSNANGAVWLQGNMLYGSTNSDIAAEFAIQISGVSSQSDLNVIL